jgi:alpha-tubulin suppressor-like RCC1 family protein
MVGLQGATFTLNDHVLALKKDGSLWAWGSDSFGQLGLGPAAVGSTVSTPTRVGSDYDWAAIACGDDYCVAIKTGGTLWTWGRNLTGQLGLGDTTGRSSPTEVTGADWKAVACGSGRDDNHTVAVKTDGTLWAWGGDQAGELGFATPGLVPQLTPRQVGSDADWQAVACGNGMGDNYTLAVKTNKTLWGWGGNLRGQLGEGDFVMRYQGPNQAGSATDWATLACGSNSFALKQNGTLWAWGANDYGQLGLGDPVAIPITSVFPLATFSDTTAPTVTASAATGRAAALRSSSSWTRTPRIIRVIARDTGSGVSRTQISLTGGVSYLTRGSVKVKNGDVRVYCRAIDRLGNRSAPRFLGHFRIDTTRPKPSATTVKVRRNATAKLRYRIADFSPCTVKIVIKNARGAVVRTYVIRGAKPSRTLTKSFRCTLAKGVYRWYVYATDSVRYKQSKAGVGKLIVS